MKKTSIKILLVMWSVILAVLIAIFIYLTNVYGDSNSFFIKSGNGQVQKQEKISLNNCSKINVNFSSSDIIVNSSDDDKLKIVQESSHKISKLRQFVIRKNGDEILIERDGMFIFNIFNFDFNSNEKIELYIPKTYTKALNIKTASGDTEVNGSELSMNEAYFKSASGDIKIKELKCKEYNIKAVSGDINADNIGGSGNINTTSGNIDVRYSGVSEYSYLKATSGDINVKIPKRINFEFYAKCASGDINSNFYLDKKKNEVQGKIGSGNYKSIKVDTTSGNIDAVQEN